MSNLSRIAGAGGSDLFSDGTYKISDGTLNVNGTPRKIHSLITQSGCTIVSYKYNDLAGEEVAGTLTLLGTALTDNTLVTFQQQVHEIVITGSAMFYFV